jgi:hypothetical protein
MTMCIPEILFLLASIFWIWMLIAAVMRERTTADKILWVVIIVFTHVIGALIYFFLRYVPRRRIV